MADAEAAGRARKATVRDEGDLVAHALAVEGGGGRQHLAHAGSALRTLVADDEDVPLLVPAVLHRLETGLLAVEAAGRAAESLLVRRHAGDLHDCTFGSEIAAKAHDSARHGDRTVGPAHHVLLGIPLHRGQVLRHGAAGHGHAVAVEKAAVEERLQDERNAADLEQVLGHIAAAGLQVRDIGSPLEDLGHVEQVERNAGLVGDGR